MSANLIGIIVTYATVNDDTVLMDAAIILSLIAFLGTMSFAYYLINKA
jgi:multicomponent Na+:H+ antiporter subunit F